MSVTQEEVIEALKEWRPVHVEKWLDRNTT